MKIVYNISQRESRIWTHTQRSAVKSLLCGEDAMTVRDFVPQPVRYSFKTEDIVRLAVGITSLVLRQYKRERENVMGVILDGNTVFVHYVVSILSVSGISCYSLAERPGYLWEYGFKLVKKTGEEENESLHYL